LYMIQHCFPVTYMSRHMTTLNGQNIWTPQT
jgi:hypothetical protein